MLRVILNHLFNGSLERKVVQKKISLEVRGCREVVRFPFF